MVFPPQEGITPSGVLVLTNWAKFGPYGVTVFIVLAGFSLSLGVSRRDGVLPRGAWAFIKSRAKRILPPYYAAILLTVVLSIFWLNHKTGTHWDLSVPLDWKGIASNLLLVQDIVPFPVTNVAYTFWSIAVEWHIYFTFPVLLILWRQYGYLAATAAGAGAGIIGGYVALAFPKFESIHPDYYALFAVGMGACAIATLGPEWAKGVPWLAVTAVALVGWAALVAFDFPRVLTPILDPDLALGLGVAGLLISVSLRDKGLVYRTLSWRPLAAIGVFSYSLYLVHAPLLQVLWMVAVEPFDLTPGAFLAVMWLVAVPLIVAAAYGFYLLAEKPFMTSTSRSHRGRRSANLAGRHFQQR